MEKEQENGRTSAFFPVRSKADFDDLKMWLAERIYNDITKDEHFQDKHGKPIIGLRYLATRYPNGRVEPERRGIVWFKDKALRDEGFTIIKNFAKNEP